jgi:acetoacetate decarboxylase
LEVAEGLGLGAAARENIDTVITELWNCTAKLEFGSGPQDPLGNIKVLEIVSAQFSHRDFAMDYGEVLHNYLPKK